MLYYVNNGTPASKDLPLAAFFSARLQTYLTPLLVFLYQLDNPDQHRRNLQYDVTETKEIYDFMLENAYKKNVGPYVALFLPRLKHFKNYDKKWQYFMDVKEMTPQKVAESSFEVIVDFVSNEIPEEYKTEVKEYFF